MPFQTKASCAVNAGGLNYPNAILHARGSDSIEGTGVAMRAGRLIGLDAARVVATLGVVWFHSIEASEFRASGVLGRFSVAFYTMAAMVFLVDSSNRRQRSIATYSWNRLRRLYLPFLGWSAITVIVIYLLNGFGGPGDLPKFSWDMLVDGGTLHLWYVPFLLVASLMVYPVAQWMRGGSLRKWLVALACVKIALALDLGAMQGFPILHGPVIGKFQELTTDRWSAVYWGVAAGILWTSVFVGSRWRWPLAVVGFVALVGATAWQWKFGLVADLKVYGGLGLLLIALAPWKNAVVRFLAPYGRMSAGVYFSHMAAIYLVRALVAADGAADGGWARDIVVFIGAVLLSFAMVTAMSVIPGLQWLAGYDASRPGGPGVAGAIRPVVAADPG